MQLPAEDTISNSKPFLCLLIVQLPIVVSCCFALGSILLTWMATTWSHHYHDWHFHQPCFCFSCYLFFYLFAKNISVPDGFILAFLRMSRLYLFIRLHFCDLLQEDFNFIRMLSTENSKFTLSSLVWSFASVHILWSLCFVQLPVCLVDLRFYPCVVPQVGVHLQSPKFPLYLGLSIGILISFVSNLSLDPDFLISAAFCFCFNYLASVPFSSTSLLQRLNVTLRINLLHCFMRAPSVSTKQRPVDLSFSHCRFC